MLYKRLSLFIALAIILLTLLMPATQVFAEGDGGIGNNRNIPKVSMDDGQVTISGLPEGSGDAWTTLFDEYRSVIAGISGVGALTMIVFFIIQFIKLAGSANNPQARSQALTGVLWTGFAAVGLGAVSLITGFFYNFL